jgi:hypothetical protein
MYNVAQLGGNTLTLYRAPEPSTTFTQVGQVTMSGSSSIDIQNIT